MCYTWVLRSDADQRLYTGCTRNLRERFRRHVEGRVSSTALRRPLTLVYYEACLHQYDAFRRERFLKSGKRKRYLKKRLRSFLAQPDNQR